MDCCSNDFCIGLCFSANGKSRKRCGSQNSRARAALGQSYVYRNENFGGAVNMPVPLNGKLIGNTFAKARKIILFDFCLTRGRRKNWPGRGERMQADRCRPRIGNCVTLSLALLFRQSIRTSSKAKVGRLVWRPQRLSLFCVLLTSRNLHT